MWYPVTRKAAAEDRDFMARCGCPVTAEAEVLQRNVDWLIEHLYKPDAKVGAVSALFEEPVNPGDLRCVEARQFADGGWQITVEEAMSGQCPKLCAYIADWLSKWGWERVEVVAEW